MKAATHVEGPRRWEVWEARWVKAFHHRARMHHETFAACLGQRQSHRQSKADLKGLEPKGHKTSEVRLSEAAKVVTANKWRLELS